MSLGYQEGYPADEQNEKKETEFELRGSEESSHSERQSAEEEEENSDEARVTIV
jgi:hypothetical protein